MRSFADDASACGTARGVESLGGREVDCTRSQGVVERTWRLVQNRRAELWTGEVALTQRGGEGKCTGQNQKESTDHRLLPHRIEQRETSDRGCAQQRQVADDKRTGETGAFTSRVIL